MMMLWWSEPELGLMAQHKWRVKLEDRWRMRPVNVVNLEPAKPKENKENKDDKENEARLLRRGSTRPQRACAGTQQSADAA